MSEHEQSARMCGWIPLECDGFQCVEQPEHGWLAPDWAAANDRGFKAGPWLATLLESHPGLFAR